MGPVWEANHVWLIFVLVVCWTALSGRVRLDRLDARVPLFIAAVGIILRGTAYALRAATGTDARAARVELVFALSSILDPFALGAAIGGIASGRVPVGNAEGDLVSSWLNPTSSSSACSPSRRGLPRRGLPGGRRDAARRARAGRGVPRARARDRAWSRARSRWPACSSCAHDAARDLRRPHRRLGARRGAGVGGRGRGDDAARLAAALRAGARDGGGRGRGRPGRLGARAAARTSCPGLTIHEAAAGRATLVALVIATAIGAVLLIPSLVILYGLLLGGRFDARPRRARERRVLPSPRPGCFRSRRRSSASARC